MRGVLLSISAKRRAVVGLIACGGMFSLAACGLLFPTALESDSDAGAPGVDASDAVANGGDSAPGVPDADAAVCGDSCAADAGATDTGAGDTTVPTDAAAADASAADVSSSPDSGDGGPACEGGAIDPLNCGTCGHDCLGGTCFQGTCRQVAILAGESAPAYVAVDATHVYWSDDGPQTAAILSALKNGTQRAPIVPSLPFANRVLSNGPFVYYNAEFNGTVAKFDVSQGVNTVFAPASTPYSPTGLALSADAGTLYWLGQADEGGVSIHAQTLPFGPQTILSHDTDGKLAQGLAADDSALFFTAGGYSTTTDHQNLKRIDATGCPDASSCGTILHAGVYITAVAVDGTYVYWSEQSAYGGVGPIARRAKDVDGGGFLTLVPSANNARFLMVDGPWLYWTEYEPATSASGPVGRVGRVATDGTGGAVYLSDHQAYPLGLASDATSIYWVNRGTITSVVNDSFANADGAILRMAK
jgi:hypothetical protein